MPVEKPKSCQGESRNDYNENNIFDPCAQFEFNKKFKAIIGEQTGKGDAYEEHNFFKRQIKNIYPGNVFCVKTPYSDPGKQGIPGKEWYCRYDYCRDQVPEKFIEFYGWVK